MKPSPRLVALLALAAVAAAALVAAGAGASAAGSDAPAGAGAARNLPRVKVAPPERRTLRRVVRLPADVLARSDVTIYGRVAGTIDTMSADVGSRVAAKDILAVISAPDVAAVRATATRRLERAGVAVQEAEAALEVARSAVAEAASLESDAATAVDRALAEEARVRAEFDFRTAVWRRMEGLLASTPGSVSQDAADQVKGSYEVAVADLGVAAARRASARTQLAAAGQRTAVARAREGAATTAVAAARALEAVARGVLDEAEVRESFAKVRAPFAGVVAERFMDPGDFVRDASSNSGASPVLRLLDDARVRVRFRVADVDSVACAPPRGFVLVVDGVPGQEFPGEVVRIAEALDLEARSMVVEGEIDNADRALRHGMFGRVRLDLEAHENVWVLPAEAVTTVKRQSSVLVVEKGRIVKRPVQIGVDDGARVEIRDGVGAEDLVVIVGTGMVTAGEEVVAVR